MKATGVVRRIDDLGRVVIPKEIRRTMRIREGDPLEIYTSNDGEVIFKQYSPVGEMSKFASQLTDSIHAVTGLPVMVCDKDYVIAVSGAPKKTLLEQRISPFLEEQMNARRKIVYNQRDEDIISVVEGTDSQIIACYPIIANGDVSGAVALCSAGEPEKDAEMLEKIVEIAALFLGKQLDD